MGPDDFFEPTFTGEALTFTEPPQMTLINSKTIVFNEKHRCPSTIANEKMCMLSGVFRLSGGARAGPELGHFVKFVTFGV